MLANEEFKYCFADNGRVEWIGLRVARQQPMNIVRRVTATAGYGLEGDKAASITSDKRQVTLIQAEYFPILEKLSNCKSVQPQDVRRNLVISGINLHALKDLKIRINDAVLEITGYCHPCSKIEAALGKGGYNAMRNHGGVTARVLSSGSIAVGDIVTVQM